MPLLQVKTPLLGPKRSMQERKLTHNEWCAFGWSVTAQRRGTDYPAGTLNSFAEILRGLDKLEIPISKSEILLYRS